MKKIKIIVVFFVILNFCIQNAFADNTVIIEINNVIINGGKVYVGIYFNETAYRNQRQDMIFEIEPAKSIILTEINLPDGEYVLDTFQDTNNNGVLDFGMFRRPKEPIGLTNYTGGIPGNFNRHKVNISINNRRVIIPLINF